MEERTQPKKFISQSSNRLNLFIPSTGLENNKENQGDSESRT
jgi:hypothetical protein